MTATAKADLDGAVLLNKPGAYDLPEADYHRDPLRHLGGSLSSTIARKLLPPSCPALARHAAENPQYRAEWDLGTVTHKLILGAGPTIVEVPADTWQTSAAKAARAEARADGAVALLSKDLRAAHAMRDAVRSHRLANALLSRPGGPERTLIWREDGTWCRAMLDYWPDPDDVLEPYIVDLKTCDSADDEHLQKNVWNYGYHQQQQWYGRGYRAVHGDPAQFLFIFVEKSPPHLVRVVQLDAELQRIAQERNDEALDVWRTCLQTDTWPGYELPDTWPGYEPGDEIALIGPPRWAYRKDYA